jgi:hypothetical protein
MMKDLHYSNGREPSPKIPIIACNYPAVGYRSICNNWVGEPKQALSVRSKAAVGFGVYGNLLN